MAKQRRGVKTRSSKQSARGRKAAPAPRRAAPRTKAKTSSKRPASPPKRAAAPVKRAVTPAAKRPVAATPKRPAPKAATPPPAPDPTPAPPPRKPGFYEAVAIYERGVQGLQRHDFSGAAELFRTVIERYPEERELLERARLYLRVCERETARHTPPPETPAEQVYAATVSLNAGDHATALHHLQRAITADPDNDHAHYIMAAALSMRGRREEALEHLHQSISLNPDNRSQALQDPDLENIRDLDAFRAIVEAPPAQRRRPTKRR